MVRSFRLWIPILAVLLLASSLSASPRVELRVIDTLAIPHDTGYLGLYLTNRLDTVAGFEITLLTDRPDLIGFIPSFDTSGTVSSGWEYLTCRAVTSPSIGIKFVGFISLNHPPNVHPGLPPSSQSRLLLKVPFFARGISDTVANRTASVTIENTPTDLGIASNGGQLIGLLIDTVYTPMCFRCIARDSLGNCTNYQLAQPPCDSSAIDTSYVNARFDTAQVRLWPGSVTLLMDCHPIPVAGDVDGSGVVDSADLSFLRFYVQYGQYPLPIPANADLNQDCCISWEDATLLDQYLAHPGSITFPTCNCRNPVRCCCTGIRGNVNNDRFGVIDSSDLSLLVAFLTGGTSSLPCLQKGDYNGNGVTDSADLALLVAYLTSLGTPPASCP